MIQNLEVNKKNAIEFYRMAYMSEPAEAVKRYVSVEYIQHNPDVENSKEGFIRYFEKMANEYPNKDIEFVRAISEDDLISIHTHQTWPGNEEYVTMDFFHFDDKRKIVKHWDSIQKIPDESKCGNQMY